MLATARTMLRIIRPSTHTLPVRAACFRYARAPQEMFQLLGTPNENTWPGLPAPLLF